MYVCPDCRKSRSKDGMMCPVCYEQARQDNAHFLNAPLVPLAQHTWHDVLKPVSGNQPAPLLKRRHHKKYTVEGRVHGRSRIVQER